MVLLTGLTSACSGAGISHRYAMASPDEMPAEVQAAPAMVKQAYQFAAANPEILEQIPCYCGCGSIGHTSNYSCYVAGSEAGGEKIFDNHALGCSVCVDITQDTMRLLDQGKSVADIRLTIDRNYAGLGPSNMP